MFHTIELTSVAKGFWERWGPGSSEIDVKRSLWVLKGPLATSRKFAIAVERVCCLVV